MFCFIDIEIKDTDIETGRGGEIQLDQNKKISDLIGKKKKPLSM